MTIERSEHVDRLKTWGCGFLIALVAAGALAAAFWPRDHDADGGFVQRVEALERRVEALERR